ncbi:MAG TPA: V-type ATPase subunit [Spirochaetia bacterium]|nr:V-type ATPase subunit [Spirochaetia bacterium]
MASALRRYAFINAKLRARISTLLPQENIDQMIRAKTLPESIQFLKDSPYAAAESVYSQTGDLKMAELELFKEEIGLFSEIGKYVDTEVKSFVSALSLRYEIENLKHALRLWFDQRIRGRNIASLTGYLYRKQILYPIDVDSIVNAESFEALLERLSGTPFAAVLSSCGSKLRETMSIFPCEMALDHYFYRTLLEAASTLKGRDRNIAMRMIGAEIDMQNITWIVRFLTFYNMPVDEALSYLISGGFSLGISDFKAAVQPEENQDIVSTLMGKKYPEWQAFSSQKSGGPFGRLLLVERLLSQMIDEEVSHAMSGYPFTIGIVLAYFILKQNEIQKLITVLNAKYYELPEERIKSVI